MKRRLALLTLVVPGLSMIGCTSPPSPTVDEMPVEPTELQTFAREAHLAALNELVGHYVMAYQEEDLDAFVALYTEDAIRMPPDQPAFSGSAAIRSDMVRTFAAQDTEITVHIDETEFSGDIAFLCGTWAVRATLADGSGTTESVGKWVNLSRRMPDGSWKIQRDIWNRDHPL